MPKSTSINVFVCLFESIYSAFNPISTEDDTTIKLPQREMKQKKRRKTNNELI